MGDYSFYRKITVDKTKVGEADTGFAVLLNLTAAGSGIIDGLETVANGGKIQNTASGGASGVYTVPADLTFRTTADLTQAGANLDFEVEFYDPATGALVAHVQSGVGTAANTDIYMIYGNADVVTSQENVAGTWDAGFKGVWHLAEASATTTVESSTGADDGTKKGAGEPAQSAGKVGSAQDFDGTDDFITVPDSANIDILGAETIEAWIDLDNVADFRQIVTKDGSLSQRSFQFYVYTSGELTCLMIMKDNTGYIGRGTTVTIPVGGGQWTHVVAAYDGGNLATGIKLYVNGLQKDTTTYTDGTFTGRTDTTAPLDIGRHLVGPDFFDGDIDEVRISNVVRTAGYVASCYNNQSSPSTFYSVGAEQRNPVNLGAGYVDVASRNALALQVVA